MRSVARSLLRTASRLRGPAGPRDGAGLRRVLFLATGVAMTAVTVFVYQVNLLEKQELQTVDARFELRGSQGAPPGMVLVEVDAATFAALRHNWPFPRSWHARVIDRLRKDGAAAIAYGVQFTEASGRTAAEISEDDRLIKAVARSSGKIVLAATEVDPRNGHTNVLGGDATLRKYGARVGNASFPGGEVIRQEAYEIDRLESFPLVASEIASRRAIRPSQLGGSSAWIDFRGPPGTIRSVSFSDVFQGKIEPGVFRGKIVVIGPAVPTLPGSQFTPTSGNELMSGPELIGNGIWTALHGFPLRSAPSGITLALIVFFGLLAPVVSLRLRLLPMLALVLLTIAAYCVSTQLAFERGLILSFVYPLCALVLSTVGAVGVHYTVAAFDRQREAFERERVRELFGRFVPEQVVDQVLARADGELRIGGVTVEGTIMFTDVRGFTSFSENRPAEQVIDVTNHYLSEMSEAIFAHGGTLISYQGDGIMAVFGAPIEQGDHADRALAAAKEMISLRLPRFNAWIRSQGVDGFRIGVGLNSGTFVAGNVGSERRLEYTAIGDIVNSASRTESLTKGTPHMLLLTEMTRQHLNDPPDDLIFVDNANIRGRRAPITLWSLESLSDPILTSSPTRRDVVPAIAVRA